MQMTSIGPIVREYFDWSGIPLEFQLQISELLHAEWPGGDFEDSRGGPLPHELHPTYYALEEQGLVYTYGRILWMTVSSSRMPLKLYGLGDVVTAPVARRRGYARRVIEAATRRITSDPTADAAILFTKPEVQSLYMSFGWESIPSLVVQTAETADAGFDTVPMLLLLTEQGQSLRMPGASLELPGHEW